MIPKEILFEAIEGGYAGHLQYKHHMDAETWEKQKKIIVKHQLNHWQTIALDPEFWRCLGKSLGWEIEDAPMFWRKIEGGTENFVSEVYEDFAHTFYNFILNQASQEQIDAFWKELQGK